MPLPSLTLSRIAGGTWSSTSARGSVLVIDVWASWCEPCSKGFPKLDALAAQRRDVVVVAISIDEDPAALRDFIARYPLAALVVQDTEHVLTRPPLSIAQLPALLIVDADGVIRHRIEKPSEDDYDHLGDVVDRTAMGAHHDRR
jgi:cytochrome c biogenesis protein CcmG, thiol:disulfide interchange protein DsbE